VSLYTYTAVHHVHRRVLVRAENPRPHCLYTLYVHLYGTSYVQQGGSLSPLYTRVAPPPLALLEPLRAERTPAGGQGRAMSTAARKTKVSRAKGARE